MMATLVLEQQRAFDDLLTAERQLRAYSEAQVRELRQLLLETAIRLDGERFEALRRENPSIPSSWTIADWSAFVKGIPSAKGWGAPIVPSNAPSKREKELIHQVEALKEQLDDAFRLLEDERERAKRELEKAKAVPTHVEPAGVSAEIDQMPVAPVPDGVTPTLAYIVKDAQNIRKGLPKRPPAPFVLDTGERVGGDLDTAHRRYFMTIYLMGRWGVNVSMEIARVVGPAEGISAGSRTLKSIMDGLVGSGMVVSKKLEIENPDTTLAVYRLTQTGKDLYKALFGVEPVEDEWTALERAGLDERTTLAVLFFTIHARKAGWMTRVAHQQNPAVVWIGREAESLHVDVTFERSGAWKSLVPLNGGKAAICTATADLRQRLSGDCKLDKVTGVATDIESLVQLKYEITKPSELWIETW
jgi:hypothetical protein